MMSKLVRWSAGVSAAVVVLSLTASVTNAANTADKVPTIETIMEEGHSGRKSLLNQIKKAVKAESWADADKPAATLKTFGEALGKNKPEKGTMESWAKLCEEYKKDTAAIAAAVAKKDKAAADKAILKIGKSCQTCHDAHQP